jgi:hypothetical protein
MTAFYGSQTSLLQFADPCVALCRVTDYPELVLRRRLYGSERRRCRGMLVRWVAANPAHLYFTIELNDHLTGFLDAAPFSGIDTQARRST